MEASIPTAEATEARPEPEPELEQEEEEVQDEEDDQTRSPGYLFAPTESRIAELNEVNDEEEQEEEGKTKGSKAPLLFAGFVTAARMLAAHSAELGL